MTSPDSDEAYQKGYEDAMRAAGQAVTPTSASARTKATSGSRNIGGRIARGTGTVIGYLVAFPFLVFLIAAGFALLGTQDVDQAATVGLFFGGLAFFFALFVGVVKVGFRVFIEAWPVILIVVIVAVILTKVL